MVAMTSYLKCVSRQNVFSVDSGQILTETEYICVKTNKQDGQFRTMFLYMVMRLKIIVTGSVITTQQKSVIKTLLCPLPSVIYIKKNRIYKQVQRIQYHLDTI